jgi:hypothetical protein
MELVAALAKLVYSQQDRFTAVSVTYAQTLAYERGKGGAAAASAAPASKHSGGGGVGIGGGVGGGEVDVHAIHARQVWCMLLDLCKDAAPRVADAATAIVRVVRCVADFQVGVIFYFILFKKREKAFMVQSRLISFNHAHFCRITCLAPLLCASYAALPTSK